MEKEMVSFSILETSFRRNKMEERYTVEYTKLNVFNDRRVNETRYAQTLDDVFEILRYSKSCKRELGLKYSSISYSDGTICSENGLKETWINEDISIRRR